MVNEIIRSEVQGGYRGGDIHDAILVIERFTAVGASLEQVRRMRLPDCRDCRIDAIARSDPRAAHRSYS